MFTYLFFRPRGYGHVQFRSAALATKALELDGSYMPGTNRFIKVDRPMTPRQQVPKDSSKISRPPGCRTVFVKNLPYDSTEAEVREVFMVSGKISTVRLAVWGHTNQLKGFGYIEFKSEESAEIAVKKSLSGEGIKVKGRSVVCDFETGKPKGSFRPALSENEKKSSK